ncbi:Pr6Pr family membrane protein [Microbacterium phyllosphaerae]|uniref:Pr6Pr family membrane protein n=1 Tax=Microbacterium phyllosphaerae TaxID=124798 RepID=UPI002169F97E|nr:Pr6Pr family membrane protein [Microbacterium phyllosphaerae]MCS3442934.1 putative membrane protein SirB2 [Microbacterium phyllosphaerae]
MTDKVCAEANMTTWWPYARLAAAVLGIAAIIAQLSRSIENSLAASTEWGQHIPTVAANFLSFFTIEANLLAAIVLAVGAIWALRHRRAAEPEPKWFAILLVCVSTYMIVTGIVYNTLLRNVELPQGVTVPWSNEVLHVVIPLFLLADVLFAPRRRALGWSAVFITALFPIVWAVYTLVRANLIIAPATGDPWWYPYPFLDPHLVPGGYLGVSGYIVGIAIAIIGVACFVVWIGRRRGASVPLTPEA